MGPILVLIDLPVPMADELAVFIPTVSRSLRAAFESAGRQATYDETGNVRHSDLVQCSINDALELLNIAMERYPAAVPRIKTGLAHPDDG